MKSEIVVTTLVLASSAALLHAQDSIRFSYELPAETSLHEPIVAELAVLNGLSEKIEIDLGWGGVGNFECRVTRADGSATTFRPQRPPGLVMLGQETLQPMQRLRHAILLSQWCEMPGEGAYDVSIRFVGRIRTASGRSVTVDQEAPYAIKVTPRDASRLRATLESLLHTALSPTSADWAVAGAAIAATNDPIVVPYLVRLGSDPRLGATAVRGLARIDSVDARSALQDLSRNSNEETAALAKAVLAGKVR